MAVTLAEPVLNGAPGPHGRRLHPAALLVIAVAALLAVCVASLGLGARSTSWATLVEAWGQFNPGNPEHAVVASRLPRTVLGLLVGAALGLSGAAIQGVTRTPLADPASSASTPERPWPWWWRSRSASPS